MTKQAIFTVEVYGKGSLTLLGFSTVTLVYSADTTAVELYEWLLQDANGYYTNQDIAIKITNSFVL
jgi:hypothetical protein